MRVVALYRVSTEKQADQGSSLDSQQRTYHDLAAKNGWTTVAEFRGCESATQAASDRRVLQQVLACLREHEPDAVYVHEQSRLTRGDELEVALLLRELRERGVKIIVGGLVRDLSSIDEGFMIGIQSLVDRTESLRIKERMGRGKRERARQGKKCSGPAPFGYENPPPGATGRGTLKIIDAEAVVVRRIFDLAMSGKGDQRVAVTLNGLGIAAPRGGKWGKSSIRRVLNCPAYLGVAANNVWIAEKGTRRFRLNMKHEKAIIVEGAHPAIIAREVWDAVHSRQSLPRTAKPRMLTGLLRVNGAAFHGDNCDGTSFYRAARGTKGAAWLLADDTDAAVWDAFAALATGPELVERLLNAASNPREQELAAQEIEYLDGEIGKAQRRLARLTDMRADGEIDKETYLSRSGGTQQTIDRLQRELAEQRSKAVVFDRTHATRVAKAVQVLLAGKTRLSGAQKHSILRSIVLRIDVAAVPTGARFARDERGRVVKGRTARWAIQSISLRLALPAAQTPHGPNVAAEGGEEIGHAAANGRAGELVTTPCDSAQHAATENGDFATRRTGHLGTTP